MKLNFAQPVFPLLIAVLILFPVAANAAVIFSIDDLLVGPPIIVGTSPYGFDPATFTISSTTSPTAEALDLHGEYISLLNLANGTSITVNFNFLESAGGLVSDTLNLVFTGHTPTGNDPSNISVDLHFRSDVDPNSLPPLVPGTINLLETGNYQALSADIARSGGPTDFQVSVRSEAIPEPASIALTGAGLVLLGLINRRRTGK